MTLRRAAQGAQLVFTACFLVISISVDSGGDDGEIQSPVETMRHALARSCNPWTESSANAPPVNPLNCANDVNGVRQLTELADAELPATYFWVEVSPRRFSPMELGPYVDRQDISEGVVRVVYDLSRGIQSNDKLAYEWKRTPLRLWGPRDTYRAGSRKLAFMNHPIFISFDGPSQNESKPRSAVIGLAPERENFLEGLVFAMDMPQAWKPGVVTFFRRREEVNSARPAELLMALEVAQPEPKTDDLLVQVAMLRRLVDTDISAAEQDRISKFQPPTGDLILGALWLSQWMIASYSHENSLELGRRLDAIADAELAKDKTVNQPVFTRLVAGMATSAFEADSPDVPFTAIKSPDEVAEAFFVARVNHIREAVAKLPKDTLSDWGKSIANYEFMPPYAPWPPEPAKDPSPQK